MDMGLLYTLVYIYMGMGHFHGHEPMGVDLLHGHGSITSVSFYSPFLFCCNLFALALEGPPTT